MFTLNKTKLSYSFIISNVITKMLTVLRIINLKILYSQKCI